MSQKIELYWRKNEIQTARTTLSPYNVGNYGLSVLQQNNAVFYDIFNNPYGKMYVLMQLSSPNAASPIDTLTRGTQTLTFPGIVSPDSCVSSITYSFVFNDLRGDGIIDTGSKYVCKIINGTGAFLNAIGTATINVYEFTIGVEINFDA